MSDLLDAFITMVLNEAMEHGIEVVEVDKNTFRFEDAPPPLGVHVIDGVGTDDKVGG